MIQTIENEKLVVKINAIGAELNSIISKKNDTEFLWQGDPSIWSSQAPVLFPIVGGLKNGTYQYKDNTYSLPKHGFIRHNKNLITKQEGHHSISFSLASSEETLQNYPFHFQFRINFELIGNQIKVTHTIKNTGNEIMYFSVGGHPAFNCPLNPSENYQDYYIELEKADNTDCYTLGTDGLISQQTISVVEDSKIPLHANLFANDALIFKNIHAHKATLAHQKKGPIVSMEFEDFPDLGIWAKPNAPYVCIEPWLGYADVSETTQNIREKEGIQQLEPSQTHQSSYTISIEN